MAAGPASDEIVKQGTEDLDGSGDKLVGHLSNYEVYAHLTELKHERSAGGSGGHHEKPNTHMSTLTYETLKYFENSPCVVQNPKVIFDFVRKVAPFGLTKTETLNILNTRPTEPIDIQAIIEESEERLTEEQVQEIIDVVEEVVPAPPGLELKTKVKQEVQESEDSD